MFFSLCHESINMSLGLSTPTTADWLNIHVTSSNVPLLYLCFSSKFLATFCLLSAKFSLYPCVLVLYLWLFFLVYCTSDSNLFGLFSFLLVSISPAHKTYNSLFSNFYDLFTDSILIWYLQVLPFYWVWVTGLAFPNFCLLYPLTYFFNEQFFISNWIPYNSNSCRQLPDKLIHHGILNTSIIPSVSTVL